MLSVVHEEIMRTLADARASYAHPVNSEDVARRLNLTPSYVREQAQALLALRLVEVRRGRGGGYFLRTRSGMVGLREAAGWA